MAKRKQTAGGWIVAILVVIALVPKEVWIGLGIVLALATAVWLWAKWQALRPKRPSPPVKPVPRPEPTLAELMEASPLPSGQSARRTPRPVAAQAAASARVEVASPASSAGTAASEAAQPIQSKVHPAQPLVKDPSGPSAETVSLARPGNLEEAKAAVSMRNAIESAARALTAVGSGNPSTPYPPQPNVDDIERARPGNLAAAKHAVTQRLAQSQDGGPGENPSQPMASAGEPWDETSSSVRDEQTSPNPISSTTECSPPPLTGSGVSDAIVVTSPRPLPSQASPSSLPDELRQVAMDSGTPAKQYAVPRPPEGWDKTRWLGPQDEIEIAGTVIRGGLFYTGPRMTTPGTREQEPSLVNGVLAVGRYGDYQSTTRYWGGYADFEPAERHAYLNWLASDRTDPRCAIQYVRLFLFGLERRILLDSVNDPASKQDWPAIEAMLRRLSSAYAAVHPNLLVHVNSLLDWMAVTEAGDQLYNAPLPTFERSYELPFYIRLALGQCSLDRAPVPAALATAWVRLNPEIPLRTAATRCAEEFDRLFAARYQETFGPGLVLPKNRTKLKFTRRPFNPALDRTDAGTKTFGDIPDVTALRVPLKGLQELVSQCTEDLGAFSRLVGKNPGARESLEGILLLPPEIWPLAIRTALSDVASDVQTASLSIKLAELLERLGAVGTALGKERIRELARVLEQSKVGIEPNVLEGARVTGENDPIVLFAMLPDQSHKTDAQAYQTAQLTLQLGSTVAQSDGAFSDHELEHLSREIESWTHLSEGDRRRLRAHLDLLAMAPVSLPALRKKLDPLSEDIKDAIAGSMATLAQVDGMVSPEEVRFLERVYKALGVDPARVFSDVHAPRPSKAPRALPKAASGAFQLDPDRIAALQRDTAQVSALLANIFTDEEATPPDLPSAEAAGAEVESAGQLLALDQAHSALLRLMLSRPVWTRAELEDSAADMELMLDGALEQINDASFDAYDIPFSDGDDPLEINPEFIEKIEQ
ncbi:TerB N-terminal domain-containing protein [Stenotrophomonas indicatrix]|uniref:tellurite resistance TerB family protein n=1 Tax=Stenotrophomonas indicatrix TaxID=2045451 RepID=UPI0028A129FD|nr:TerB N-terminal domain-containing protein [Stenotrophomonas indicatrix]